MEKKEYFKDTGFSGGNKFAGFPAKTFSIIKLVIGVFLLAYIYSFTASFIGELELINKELLADFWHGVITFIIIYAFIYDPLKIYRHGQKMLEAIFKFFAPLVKIASYVLPFYALIIFSIYTIILFIFKNGQLAHLFVFLFGLSLAFHLVLTAKILRSKQSDFLRANYIFGISFVYILNLNLAALCFNIIFENFSFVNFFNNAFKIAQDIYLGVFNQIFAVN